MFLTGGVNEVNYKVIQTMQKMERTTQSKPDVQYAGILEAEGKKSKEVMA